LIEGYRRGWLSFTYPQKSSRLREELILNSIVEDRTAEILQTRLLIESSLGAYHRSKELGPSLDKLNNSILELRLPSALPKPKLGDVGAGISKTELLAWKELLNSAKASKKT